MLVVPISRLMSFTSALPWHAASTGHAASSGRALTDHHFAPQTLRALSAAIEQARIRDCDQSKAFCADNSADSFFSTGNDGLSWICWGEACAELADAAWGQPDATIATALDLTQAPLACRVASSRGQSSRGQSYSVSTDPKRVSSAVPEVVDWLSALDAITGRPFCDADVYCTPSVTASASLGWHVDDVDVLLIMLRGRKRCVAHTSPRAPTHTIVLNAQHVSPSCRFRVAGRSFGSSVAIDTTLEAGDVLFIPALTFHSGGGSAEDDRRLDNFFRSALKGWTKPAAGESVMLSVALPWADDASRVEAQAAAADWRIAIEDLDAALPERCNRWSFAATREGRAAMADVLEDGAVKQFLPTE